MDPTTTVLKHEKSTKIEHTIRIGDETLKQKTESKTKVTYSNNGKKRATTTSVLLHINDSLKAYFRETNDDGKVERIHNWTIPKSQQKKFANKWMKFWKPKIKESELAEAVGKSYEPIKLAEEYKDTLAEVQNYV
jgi:hypothetical protein